MCRAFLLKQLSRHYAVQDGHANHWCIPCKIGGHFPKTRHKHNAYNYFTGQGHELQPKCRNAAVEAREYQQLYREAATPEINAQFPKHNSSFSSVIPVKFSCQFSQLFSFSAFQLFLSVLRHPPSAKGPVSAFQLFSPAFQLLKKRRRRKSKSWKSGAGKNSKSDYKF